MIWKVVAASSKGEWRGGEGRGSSEREKEKKSKRKKDGGVDGGVLAVA